MNSEDAMMNVRAPDIDSKSDLPEGGKRRWFGAGVITGAADDDPSGIGTYAQAGAQFGTNLLWVTVFTFPLMVVVQLISAKIARVTGRGLAANLTRIMPRWVLVPMLALLFAANTINIGADLAAMGEAAALLVPVDGTWMAAGFGVISTLLQIFVPYKRYVRLLQWLTMSLLVYVGIIFAVDVPWRDVLHSALVPRLEMQRAFWAMLVGVLGTTISPYLFFWQSAQEVEDQSARQDEQPIRKAPEQADRQLQRARVETVVGMAVSNTVAFFIVLTAALTLHTHGQADIDSAVDAAQALKPIAGAFASGLFAIGIVGTGLLAIPVLAGSAGYAIAEAFGWHRGLERPAPSARRFYGVIATAALLGVGFTLLHINPMRGLVWAAILNGLISTPLLIMMLMAAANRQLMGEFAIGPLLKVGGWITTVLMATAALMLAWA
jgi:NRAMP (natural resistance-associated macrophage protein)-like metal ion transporter